MNKPLLNTSLTDALAGMLTAVQKAFKSIARAFRRVLLTWHLRAIDIEEKSIRDALRSKVQDLFDMERYGNEVLAANLRRRHSLIRRLAELDAEGLL